MRDLPDPGVYHAQGDPPNTFRYWDGTSWHGEPTYRDGRSAARRTPSGFAHFAHLGPRMGAAFIDSFIVRTTYLIVLDISGSPDNWVKLTLFLVNFFSVLAMTAIWGATPGKMLLRIRVTSTDGHTSPPGILQAALRAAIYSALISQGVLLVRIMGIVTNMILINTDKERRSLSDLVGATRVVKQDSLYS